MEYFADVSNFQWNKVPSYDEYTKFLKAAKSKYKVKSTCVLLTDGTTFHSPARAEQIKASLEVFKSFSCFHFFRGDPDTEANCFINDLKNMGADKSTVVMIDAEIRYSNLTTKINKFIDKLYDAGYKHIYVYSMASMLDYANDGIQTGKLHHNAKRWIASYGSIQPGGSDVWQFTSNAIANGVAFDLDKDFIGELSNGVKETTSKPKQATYWQYGKWFKAKNDLTIYADADFNHKTEGLYVPGTKFYVDQVIKPNGDKAEFSRFKVDGGYVSANTDFSHRIK